MIFHVGRFCVCFVQKLKGRWEQGVNWDCELLSCLLLYRSRKLLQQFQCSISYCSSLPVLHHVTSSTVCAVYSWTKGISSKFINATFDGSCNKWNKIPSFLLTLYTECVSLFTNSIIFCLKNGKTLYHVYLNLPVPCAAIIINCQIPSIGTIYGWPEISLHHIRSSEEEGRMSKYDFFMGYYYSPSQHWYDGDSFR